MFDMFRDKQLKKKYICAVKNNPKIKDGIYKAYLTKNSQRGFVTVSDKPLNNASQDIETGIKTLDYFDEMGLYAFSSAINLILIVTILLFNTLVNKLTGASLDSGIGGSN